MHKFIVFSLGSGGGPCEKPKFKISSLLWASPGYAPGLVLCIFHVHAGKTTVFGFVAEPAVEVAVSLVIAR